MSVNTLCSHHWTVTSECPKCLRERLAAVCEVRRRHREWLGIAAAFGKTTNPVAFGKTTNPVSEFARATLANLDALERELLGEDEWKKWNETPFPFEEK